MEEKKEKEMSEIDQIEYFALMSVFVVLKKTPTSILLQVEGDPAQTRECTSLQDFIAWCHFIFDIQA